MSSKSSIFFGGEGSSLGKVQKLSANSFASLVKEMIGHPAIINTSRAQFHALPKATRDKLKRVLYVTPAAFNQDQSDRLTPCATVCNLIALDIDSGSIAAPFYRSPGVLTDALHPYSFAMYATASSTPEAPRLRLLVAAHQLPLKLYPKAVRYIGSLLGITDITKESFVPVQPMYLPTMFKDEDPLTDHPLIASNLGGTELSAEEVESAETADPSSTSSKQKPSSFDERDTSDDLAFLRPTVESITPADVRQALEHLEPDCSYPEWLEVASALRHQFPREPLSEEAYKLFDEWSSKGKKYVDSADTLAKWRSLRQTPKGRIPVTIRTLFHRATEAGWAQTSVAAKCYQEVLHWISDPVRTANELMVQGIKRIASAPMQTPVERGSLLSRLQDALKGHKLKVSTTDLKRSLRTLERAVSAANQTPHTKALADNQLPPWARGLCYVAGANEFYQRTADKRMPPDVLDKVYSVFLMNSESAETGKPPMKPQDYLLNLARIPRVDHYRYCPDHPEQTFVTEGKRRFVNMYIPTYPEADLDDADAAGEVLVDHLEKLIGEADYRATLLDFLAYHVQHPGQKIRWATLIQGAQGCGKTALAVMMQGVLGKMNVSVMDASLLFGAFNGWASGAQLVAMEEVRIVGHNRHEVMNRLKPCISNDTLNVRRLYQEAVQEPNITNYIMFTNYHDSLAVTEGDRRYFVLNSALQTKAQVQALGDKHFRRLFDTIKLRTAGLRAFLENHKIGKTFNPHGHAPTTHYLKSLTKASASPLTAAVADVIGDMMHPLVRQDLLSSKAVRNLVDPSVPTYSDQTLAAVLRELDYVSVGRYTIDDQRHYLWGKRGTKWSRSGEVACEEANRRLVAGLETNAFDADEAGQYLL